MTNLVTTARQLLLDVVTMYKKTPADNLPPSLREGLGERLDRYMDCYLKLTNPMCVNTYNIDEGMLKELIISLNNEKNTMFRYYTTINSLDNEE